MVTGSPETGNISTLSESTADKFHGLNEQEKRVLEAILRLLEGDTKLQAEVTAFMRRRFDSFIHSPEKLDQLLVYIRDKMQYEIRNTEAMYKDSQSVAGGKILEIIKHYTALETLALQRNLQ